VRLLLLLLCLLRLLLLAGVLPAQWLLPACPASSCNAAGPASGMDVNTSAYRSTYPQSMSVLAEGVLTQVKVVMNTSALQATALSCVITPWAVMQQKPPSSQQCVHGTHKPYLAAATDCCTAAVQQHNTYLPHLAASTT
jgi:hypothetical protein